MGVSLLIYLSVVSIACEKNLKDSIEGYWVSSDMTASVAFDENNTIVVDGKYIGEYAIYDENKMAINVDTATFDDVYDIALSAEFKVSDGILYINDLEGRTYRYYSEEKVKTLINEKYKTIYNNSIVEQYMPEILSYPDEWELYLEGTQLEGVITKDEVKKNSVEAIEFAEKEILKLYESSILDDEFVFCCTCDSVMYIWDTICYEITVRCEEVIGKVCTYAVDPVGGKIYKEDAEGFFLIWDGTIAGNSILKEI